MLFGPLDRLIKASESYFPLFSLNGKLPGTIAPPLLVEQQLPSLPRLDELLCLSPERPVCYLWLNYIENKGHDNNLLSLHNLNTHFNEFSD